jgi:hypothetical protein
MAATRNIQTNVVRYLESSWALSSSLGHLAAACVCLFVGWLVGWLAGCLAGWLVGWSLFVLGILPCIIFSTLIVRAIWAEHLIMFEVLRVIAFNAADLEEPTIETIVIIVAVLAVLLLLLMMMTTMIMFAVMVMMMMILVSGLQHVDSFWLASEPDSFGH